MARVLPWDACKGEGFRLWHDGSFGTIGAFRWVGLGVLVGKGFTLGCMRRGRFQTLA